MKKEFIIPAVEAADLGAADAIMLSENFAEPNKVNYTTIIQDSLPVTDEYEIWKGMN